MSDFTRAFDELKLASTEAVESADEITFGALTVDCLKLDAMNDLAPVSGGVADSGEKVVQVALADIDPTSIAPEDPAIFEGQECGWTWEKLAGSYQFRLYPKNYGG